jgi:DnaK suppressor protein
MPKKQTMKSSKKPKTKTIAKKPVKKTTKAKIRTATKTAAKKTTKKTIKAATKKTTVIKPVKSSFKTSAKSTKISTREKKVQEIKKDLLNQKKSLLAGAMEALNELPGQTVFPDLGDQATAEIDRNFMLRLKGRERKLLKKIDEAIDRMDEGIFGICEKCGEEINIKRLEARPVTTMCIECKTLQEEEEKLMEK